MNKRTALILLIGFICLVQSAFATETATITGTVSDVSTLLPLEGVSITIDNTTRGATTDTAGAFAIEKLPAGEYGLSVSRVGYLTTHRKVRLDPGDAKNIQVALEPTALELDRINVTVARFAEETFASPSPVSITTEREFAERTFSTTAEVLREEPGILVQKTTAGHGAPIIRGLIGKHVLLLYDGIRLNRPTFRYGANQYLNTIDLESLDRIEVVRGPSSVMYGSDALGGAINLIPGRSRLHCDELVLTPSVSTRYSSADNGSASHITILGDYHDLAAQVGLSYKYIDDLRAGGDIGKQKPTGWEEVNLTSRLQYWLNNDNTVSVDYLMVRQDDVARYDKYECGEFEQYVYDPQDRDLAAVTFTSQNRSDLVRTLKANLSYCREKEGTVKQKTGKTSIDYGMDKITTWGGYAQAALTPHVRHTVHVGGEYYYDVVRSSLYSVDEGDVTIERPTYPDNSKYHSLGVFLEDEWAPAAKLKVTAGVRYSVIRLISPLEEPYGEYDETYDDITGALALTFTVHPNVNLIGRWAQGFRAPNLNDGTVVKYSSSGVDVPTMGLKPEQSNNFEIGIKYQSSHADGSLFAFYNKLKDFIDRIPGSYNGLTFFDEDGDGIQDEDEYDVYERKNVTDSYIYGFEFAFAARLNRVWETRLNGLWMHGESNTDDEPMSRIPPLMGLLSVRAHLRPDFWVESFVRAADAQRRLSQRDIDDTRIGPEGTDDWVTLNIRARYSYEKWYITLALENVTDKAYKEHGSGVYSPGRNLLVGLGYGL
ncbi:MAG: TonB-dependent receptor [candidate division Zixibacteria bacterium]|nr:TonB-dependent receptor [candidate division Zixibacteria bacterium]